MLLIGSSRVVASTRLQWLHSRLKVSVASAW